MVTYLQKVDVFKDLTKEEIETLFHGVMLRECQPGTMFFSPDDASERLFILKEGQVDIYRLTPSGKRLVTRRIGPGTIFGEIGLLGQTMQGCFAEASSSSLVCIATKEDLVGLLRQRPDVALRMLEAIGARLKLLEERLEQAAFSSVKARLASFLLANAGQQNGTLEGYTHAEIGDTIGALRQTVTETLSELQRQGLVEVGHKLVRIMSRSGLEGIAGE
ncbi:MAG: Crp/Fnr family transcriptional regulator [Chloroflexi bacterium]|nr:Crp/Fnr family transcriptional regulator [Chloroflexota bacterium]